MKVQNHWVAWQEPQVAGLSRQKKVPTLQPFILYSQVDRLPRQCGYNRSLSELLNWTFLDWRINRIKIREPKQAPKVWCSSPLNIRRNSSSIICAKIGFEHVLKRRGRGHPATAASEMSLPPTQRTWEQASSPYQHLAAGSCSREKPAGKERLFSQLLHLVAWFFCLFSVISIGICRLVVPHIKFLMI